MTTQAPEAEAVPTPGADTPVLSAVDGARSSASGPSCEHRLADLLDRLADADAISASRVRAWDRLQERRASS